MRRAWDWVRLADRLVRLHLAFFTVTWMLLGAASVPRGMSAIELGALLGVALCFHVFAYVLNDVLDLSIDRTQSARQQDLLVRGVVGRRLALALALVQPLLTLPLVAFLHGGVPAYGAILGGFLLMGAYNVWGKRCLLPPLTDAVQGLAWGSLVVFGALALGARPGALTWTVTAYAAVFTIFINGIHGSFRDLANDHAHGARTTALFFGARPAPGGEGRVVPVTLAAYAHGILAVLVGLNAVLVLRNDFHYGAVAWMATGVMVAGINVWAIVLQRRVLRPSAGSDVAWRLQMYMMVSVLPMAFAAHASVGVLAVLALSNLLALLLFDTTAAVTRCAWSTLRLAGQVSFRQPPAGVRQLE